MVVWTVGLKGRWKVVNLDRSLVDQRVALTASQLAEMREWRTVVKKDYQ